MPCIFDLAPRRGAPECRARTPLAPVAAVAALLLSLVSTSTARADAPGDTTSVVTLSADFGSDNPNAPPNTALPGDPVGDFLTLDLASGTVKVVPSYDGLSRPVEIRQVNDPGRVALNAFPAATPYPAEQVTVRWRSVAKDDEASILIAFAVRASNGATLASVEYRHQGTITYNGLGGAGTTLPITQTARTPQAFAIGVDFVAGTTSLSVDGVALPGFQGVPFAESGGDMAQLSVFGEGGHPQTVYVDDLSMVARYRVPDIAPSVTAPIVVDGEEGGVLLVDVTASDPDDDITSLTADLAELPAGHGAVFTAASDQRSGTLRWPMKQGEAGTYDVVFTAANGQSASATTRINVALAGTTLTGELIWTPQPGEEGTYTVTFTATNALNESGSSLTTIVVSTPAAATLPVTPPSSRGGTPAPLAPEAPLRGPIVSSPGTVSAATSKQLTVSATATDDGAVSARTTPIRAAWVASTSQAISGIVSFDADLDGLPPGNNAIFVVDQEPVVTAPSALTVDPGSALSFPVTASDPDGAPLLDLTADLSVLPAGHTAEFTTNASFTSGTFAWTPRNEDAGTYAVAFTSINALVGRATTAITVRAISPARVFLVGSKKIRLSSNRPFGCMQLEPVAGSFSLLDVDLTSIRMVSVGTGTVSEIPANTTKSAVLGDRDNNTIQDMQICFGKADMRALFNLLRGSNSVPVQIHGRLLSGPLFQGSVTLDVVAGGGALQAVLSPNPLRPTGTLQFVTRTAGPIRVSMYDLQGRLVRRIWESSQQAPGVHEVPFVARAGDGRALPSGVYFYRIESRDGIDTGRFTLLK
jgi:hypothetical protein